MSKSFNPMILSLSLSLHDWRGLAMVTVGFADRVWSLSLDLLVEVVVGL